MMIFTSWMNLATMSFPYQPLIQYRAVVRARRPLKSSTRPASEGSRRYVIRILSKTRILEAIPIRGIILG